MRGGLGLVMGMASFSGCAKLDLPPEEPSTCVASVSLDGSQSSAPSSPSEREFYSVGPVGTADICMHLDATRNQVRAHLAVTLGEGAGFRSVLLDLDGVTLREGWDVLINDRVVHNLEWTLDAGETRDVILRVTRTVSPSGTSVMTPVHVSLFEPRESLE